jgi:glyoxylase-like metal-dependent hydrolase (beta-lactamase superfamily II)
MTVETFCGGDYQTNGYYLPQSGVLIDAPEGVFPWLAGRGLTVSELWLTHGHFDHILDAGKIAKNFGCPVRAHTADLPMLDGRVNWRSFGLVVEVPVLRGVHTLTEGDVLTVGGTMAHVLHVPGHSPGSVCFYFAEEGLLFGGDVLFAGGVGRWDLPGGDGAALISGIREKLLPLPPQTRVLPGHGPSTTLGEEAATNPYL